MCQLTTLCKYPYKFVKTRVIKKPVPIRHTLLAAFLLVGLLPIVLMSYLAFNEAKQALTTEITRDMQTRATATASEVDRMMFERLQNVASWSTLEIMQDARIDDVDKRLSHFLNELKTSYKDVYANLYVINDSGHIIASSDAKQIGKTYTSTPDWLALTLPNKTIQLSTLRNMHLAISADIIDNEDAHKLGKLIVEFNWVHIHDILRAAVSGRSAAAIFDNQNQLIAQTDNWDTASAGHLIKAEALANDYVGLNWRLVIAQHKSEVLAPVRHMSKFFIALLVASVILAAVIALPLAAYISKPLAKLTQFATHFIRSPTKKPSPMGGPAEVRDLSYAFNKMIADLEQSKEALTRAAKLAVAGEMAAAMSHEVRTPLGILRSSAQILLREPNLSAEAKEVCGFIMSETERLNKLVTTLIDAGRPRAPEYLAVNLSDIAEQAAAMMRMQADKKSITLQYQKAESIMVACDDEQITQVLLNLLLNAIQILPEGGKILLSITQQAEFAVIEVADNGTGVPVEMQSQIFDPFFTQREGGIGLGLAVVRQIVEAHQGQINVSNGKPESAMPGAHFRVQLPIFGGYRE